MRRKILYIPFVVFVFCSFVSCGVASKISKSDTGKLTEEQQIQRDYYFYEAIRLKESGNYDEALETLLLCNEIDSENAEIHSELGLLFGSLGLKEKAVSHLENAVKIAPKDWWYSYQLISYYLENKEINKAIDLAKQAQKFHSDKQEIYSVLATLYTYNKDYKNAIKAFDELERFLGLTEGVSLEKFRLHLMNNDSKKAFAEIERLIEKYPTEVRYKVLKANLFLHQNQMEEAFALFQEALKEDPQSPLAHVGLADYYKAAKLPEKALEAIETALKNDMLDVETKIQILGQYVQATTQDSTRAAETESLLKLLVDRYPLEEQVHTYYYVFLRQYNKDREAISVLETMLNINPKNEQSWGELIQYYFSKEDYGSMLKTADDAIENIPDKTQFYFFKGIALSQKKEYNKAIETYKAGLPYVAASQEALKGDLYSQIADCYYKINEKDSAFTFYERALSSNPANLYLMNNYAYYLSLEKKDLRKAEMMSAKTVEADPDNSTFLDTYAWILYQRGSYSLARIYIVRAVENMKEGEDNGVIYDHYGDILWMLKEDDKALEMWQKAYDAGENTVEVKQKIENKGWDREKL